MKRRHSKAYLREQRRDMIRILERSLVHWRDWSARYHRLTDEVSALLTGHAGGLKPAHEMLEFFRGQAETADGYIRRDEQELRKWRAKRI